MKSVTVTRANMDIVLDCTQPQRFEEFSREALGYRVLGHDGRS